MTRLIFVALTALALSACAPAPNPGPPGVRQTAAVSNPNSQRCVDCIFEGYGDRCPPGC